MISQRMRIVEPRKQDGTWVAAGAINDTGTATATTTPPVQVGSTDKGRFTATHVLTSAAGRGTITLEGESEIQSFPPPSPPRPPARIEGTWEITGATGTYANLRGRGSGKLYATVDPTTQEVTIVRDGKAG
jgi:hypothetical protein